MVSLVTGHLWSAPSAPGLGSGAVLPLSFPCHPHWPRQAITQREPRWALWTMQAMHLKSGKEESSYNHSPNGLATNGGGGDRQGAGELEGEGQAPEDHSGTVGHLVL